MSQYSDEYWEERLPKDCDERVKRAIKRIYGAYPKDCMPQGLSDPMYIMNVICFELGIGDGNSNFNLPKDTE